MKLNDVVIKGETKKMPTLGHFINNEIICDDSSLLDVINPANGRVSSQVSLASHLNIEHAIDAAQKAFPGWRNTPPNKRSQIFYKYKQILEENKSEIANIIGQEQGKVKHDAMGEIQRAIESVEFACGISQLLKGEHSKNVSAGIDTWSEHHPLGVVVGITPFNFPVMVPMWMIPLAIACGNTFILKPSEHAPRSALFIAELLRQAGLPKGVLNVINGDKQVVDALVTDNRTKAISFVGSTAVAESIYSKASAYGKRCQALGGAKNHAIVMPDCAIENTANQLLGASFGSSGERCMALSVAVVIGDTIGDALVSKLKNKMAKLRVGPYFDNNNDFGPVISVEHKQKIIGHINSAINQGATLVVDGRTQKTNQRNEGYFLGATLLDHVKPDMDSYHAEIFGPVLQIIRVDNTQQAIDLVNLHQYGNGACIFTQDGEAAHYFSEQVECGMVGINVALPVPVAYHSFGGWKRSLFGDLHAYGPDGVSFYTKRKAICQRWPTASVRENISFSFPA
jgi:malonate-semialdehyde dehydrogenase (acetylating) / methylmalonate-semialdehyde dehydrogenase